MMELISQYENGFNTMLTMFKFAVFIVVSVALYHISRESLRSYRSHGFYRFFAWEAVVALILLNLNIRAYQPSSAHHYLAIACLVLSGILGIHGFLLLHRDGRPGNQRDDPTLLTVEKTTALVTSGAYKYVRHPLYSSYLLLTWGSFLFIPSRPAGLLACVATLSVIIAARVEERENLQYFGTAYHDYMKRTTMFIPFVL
jgi:protein-S-isoprenylcysteine O-methyltransferase Ste14